MSKVFYRCYFGAPNNNLLILTRLKQIALQWCHSVVTWKNREFHLFLSGQRNAGIRSFFRARDIQRLIIKTISVGRTKTYNIKTKALFINSPSHRNGKLFITGVTRCPALRAHAIFSNMFLCPHKYKFSFT